MPRNLRQRPAWLPSWVPYKDGRYLGLAKQTIICDRHGPNLTREVRTCLAIQYHPGPSRSLRSAWRLSCCLRLCVIRSCSMALISRPEGIQLPQFLALQWSTGPLGLLAIASGQGLPAAEWPMKPRLMSLLRLVAQAVVPSTGVLIMSRNAIRDAPSVANGEPAA
jgi:hypothetical protein